MFAKINKNTEYCVFLIILAVCTYGPIWLTNYIGDDMAYSIMLHTNTLSIWDYTLAEFNGWWMQTGRITYLAWLAIRIMFGAVDNLFAYKTYLVLANIFAFFSVLILAFCSGISKPQISYLALCVACTVQIRGSSDPYTTFHGLMPLCTGFITLSIACYLVGRRLLAAVFYIVSLLLYEVSYILLPIVIMLSIYRNGFKFRELFKDVWPYLIITAITLIISFGGKYYGINYLNISPHKSYEFQLEWIGIAYVSLKQVVGSIPLSYMYLTDRSGNSGIDIHTNKVLWIILLTFVPLIPIIVYNTKFWDTISRYVDFDLTRHTNNSAINKLLLVGTIYAVLPGMLIALSAKYQGLVKWSEPYITSYISAIGVSIIIQCCIYFACKAYETSKKKLLTLIVLLVPYISVISLGYNYYNAYLLGKAWNPQEIIKSFVWNDPMYETCNLIYSDKWTYWEEKLFNKNYHVDENRTVKQELKPGECFVTRKNGSYEIKLGSEL